MARTHHWKEKLSRLEAMVADDGDTWDLSGNDKAAIQFALDVIHVAQMACPDAKATLPDDLGDGIRECLMGE